MTTKSQYDWQDENDLFDSQTKMTPDGTLMYRDGEMREANQSNFNGKGDYPHVTIDLERDTAHFSTDGGAKGEHSESWGFGGNNETGEVNVLSEMTNTWD